MGIRSTTEIQDALVSLIAEIGREEVRIIDQNLFELGLLDSANMMDFLLTIEAQFDVNFDDDDLELGNFSSVRRLAALLEKKVGKRPSQ